MAGSSPKPGANLSTGEGGRCRTREKGLTDRQGIHGERETTERQKINKLVTHGDSHGKGRMNRWEKQRQKAVGGTGEGVRGSEMGRKEDLESRTDSLQPQATVPHTS